MAYRILVSWPGTESCGLGSASARSRLTTGPPGALHIGGIFKNTLLRNNLNFQESGKLHTHTHKTPMYALPRFTCYLQINLLALSVFLSLSMKNWGT